MKNKARLLLAPIVLAFTSLAMADITLTAGDFVQNTDGTVTHTPTGLVWQACSVGQTWDGTNGTCTGTAKTYSYTDAMKVKSDFAGKTDWRVPNIVELHTLIDFKKTSPAINKSLFPQIPPDLSFLSSSVYKPNISSGVYQWGVKFVYGEDYISSPGEVYYIRLVRGDVLQVVPMLKEFIDNKDGTVSNIKTGLTWQRCAVGQNWNNGGCDGKSITYTQDKAIELIADTSGQTDWRLPTLTELLTIVDYSQSSPAINSIIFPDTPSNYFWTSNSAARDIYRMAWALQFYGGTTLTNYIDSVASARLVRGSMTTSPSVNSGGIDLSTSISGTPNPATVNGNMTFTATLTNKGTLTATDAKLSFALPKSVSLVTKPTECISNGLSVLCSVGSLAPSGSVTKSVTVKMAKAGGLTFGVTSWAAEKDTNTADNVARTTVAIRK